jgi:hypothetical protein
MDFKEMKVGAVQFDLHGGEAVAILRTIDTDVDAIKVWFRISTGSLWRNRDDYWRDRD